MPSWLVRQTTLASGFLVASLCLLQVVAFDNTRYDNVAVYWGQDSHGASDSSDTADYQKTLSYYCQDDAIDAIPVAFVNTFFGTGGLPVLNLANTCNPTDNATFAGTDLVNCASLASDIEYCQSKGKIVTLSLGGAGGTVGFANDSQAQGFADQIWNIFLGGSSSTRPFGSAVLDGVDLDIEGGSTTGYAAFVNQLRSHTNGASKTYYVTAAPQCEYPDSYIGAALNAASFDAVYVQFYNNPCGLTHYGEANNWDFGLWDYWARNVSPNPNVKIYIGAPGSSAAAGTGYVDIGTLQSIATAMRKSFPSFGGVMLWDASQAYPNGRYDLAIKNTLTSNGGTGFTFPACSAPAFVSGTGYSASSNVTYNGYIWENKWWSSNTPTADENGDWSPITACSGASTTSSPTSVSSTSSASTSTPTSGACGGVAAWSSSVAYTGGSTVTYNGDLWSAQWWTEGDTPGSSAGVWTDKGSCSSSKRAVEARRKTLPSTSRNSRFFRF